MSTAAASPLAGLRVLVVEDEFIIAVMIEDLLAGVGCEIAGPVAKIDEALSIIRSTRLDGVLLDANLNGESSAPIAAELQSRNVPFVVVTGYGRLELPTEALNMAPRVTKPFGNVEFEQTLSATFAH